MKSKINLPQKISLLNNQSGQSFVEFILLLLILFTLSWGVLKSVNGNVGKRWIAMTKVIMSPSQTPIELR